MDDRAYLYGDALFETVAVRARHIARLDAHAARLTRSGASLGFPAARIDEGVRALRALPRRQDGLYRVTVSRPGQDVPFGGGPGSVTVRRRELPAPVRPRLSSLRGWYWPGDPLAAHKTADYLRYAEARRRAVDGGADDALLLDADGRLGEASAASVVLVQPDGTLVTPRLEGILPGVTRAAALALARANGQPIDEVVVPHAMLDAAREVILLSAAVGALSAASLDGRPLEARVGPMLAHWLEAP